MIMYRLWTNYKPEQPIEVLTTDGIREKYDRDEPFPLGVKHLIFGSRKLFDNFKDENVILDYDFEVVRTFNDRELYYVRLTNESLAELYLKN